MGNSSDGPKGGKYKDVRKGNTGGEVHHMPADSVNGLPRGEGPSILMETEDHRKTKSWGRSKKAQQYRMKQKELIDAGKFDEAQQMDIDDIHDQFGDKYDDAINDMLENS